MGQEKFAGCTWLLSDNCVPLFTILIHKRTRSECLMESSFVFVYNFDIYVFSAFYMFILERTYENIIRENKKLQNNLTYRILLCDISPTKK